MDQKMVQKMWSIRNFYSNSIPNKYRRKTGNKSVNHVQKENPKPPGLIKNQNSQNRKKPSCDKCINVGHTANKGMSGQLMSSYNRGSCTCVMYLFLSVILNYYRFKHWLDNHLLLPQIYENLVTLGFNFTANEHHLPAYMKFTWLKFHIPTLTNL